MSNMTEYKDVIAFHPGYYIAEIIEDLEISQNEFAARLGISAKVLSTLIHGQNNLSNELAGKLSSMLGTSTDIWLNLQKEYDKKILMIQKEKELDAQKEILAMLDYSFFERIAGWPHTRDIREKIANLCQYLMVSDLRILTQPDFLVNYRTGIPDIQTKNLVNSRAWIQTAINVSHGIQTAPFSMEKLKASLPELRSMTLQKTEVFLPRMKVIFADCGVAFVLLPHLKNSGINGAVKWVNSGRVVLAMNNRGTDADQFWFSLFHEIKHVLQKKIKTTFLSCSFTEMTHINAELESEADTFAENYLIPTADYQKFKTGTSISDVEIVRFANEIGIHPGIVAGRLQHDGILPPNRCSKLKEKYRIISSEQK